MTMDPLLIVGVGSAKVALEVTGKSKIEGAGQTNCRGYRRPATGKIQGTGLDPVRWNPDRVPGGKAGLNCDSWHNLGGDSQANSFSHPKNGQSISDFWGFTSWKTRIWHLTLGNSSSPLPERSSIQCSIQILNC